MSRKYSWHKASGDDERRQQALLAEEQRRRREQSIAAGRAQREEVNREVIQPFLVAMRRAGNPGLGLFGSRWILGLNDKGRRSMYAGRPIPYMDVYTNGRWLMGEAAGMIGAGETRDMSDPWRYSSSFDVETEVSVLSQSTIEGYQAMLASLMRRHDVPLPPD